MYTNPQKRGISETVDLRKEAGRWLRDRREARGLSQRQLAELIGVEYYTFISQLETGRGRIPPDKYRSLGSSAWHGCARFRSRSVAVL